MKLKAMLKQAEMPPEPPKLGDVSVQRLIDDSLTALAREVKNLLMSTAKGKLTPTDARDLRDNLKLLFELKDREDDSLRDLTDEQLAAMTKDALDVNKQNSPSSGSSEASGDS